MQEQISQAGFAMSFRNLYPDEPLGKVLYRDQVVIRQIYDSVTATANLDSSLAERILFRTTNDPYEQIAQLECSPQDNTNFDYLVLLLSSIVQYKGSVGDLIRKISQERANKSVDDFAYPGMPVRVCGVVRYEGDVYEKEIYLYIDECSVCVLLDQEHSLDKDIEFLRERFLFVLGTVFSIKDRTKIKAGALLL